jgi:hypothetical protein
MVLVDVHGTKLEHLGKYKGCDCYEIEHSQSIVPKIMKKLESLGNTQGLGLIYLGKHAGFD